MAKKKDRVALAKKSQPLKLEGVSRRGWKVIGLGIGIAGAGFYVLSLTDPAGQNWASNLSPFLILGGYAVIGVGIILPDGSPREDSDYAKKEN
jgi:dipeptide/tripeptide permease